MSLRLDPVLESSAASAARNFCKALALPDCISEPMADLSVLILTTKTISFFYDAPHSPRTNSVPTVPRGSAPSFAFYSNVCLTDDALISLVPWSQTAGYANKMQN